MICSVIVSLLPVIVFRHQLNATNAEVHMINVTQPEHKLSFNFLCNWYLFINPILIYLWTELLFRIHSVFWIKIILLVSSFRLNSLVQIPVLIFVQAFFIPVRMAVFISVTFCAVALRTKRRFFWARHWQGGLRLASTDLKAEVRLAMVGATRLILSGSLPSTVTV